MERIVDKFVDELQVQLRQKKVRVKLTDAGRKVLADKGYDPAFGARPLGRVIEERIKRPLTEEILFGALEEGGKVTVDGVNGDLRLRFEAKKSRK
jgi:ATP-dependent Clp protease ATP-binding subunit ClpA